jgi:hypothetical protein
MVRGRAQVSRFLRERKGEIGKIRGELKLIMEIIYKKGK